MNPLSSLATCIAIVIFAVALGQLIASLIPDRLVQDCESVDDAGLLYGPLHGRADDVPQHEERERQDREARNPGPEGDGRVGVVRHGHTVAAPQVRR